MGRVANDLFGRASVMDVDVQGLKAVQDELQALTMQASVGQGLRANMNKALLMLQRYALGIVHVDTGRLKNSLFTEIVERGNDLTGYLATNVAYAAAEEGRDGDHAFFGRTVREEGPAVNDLFSVRSS